LDDNWTRGVAAGDLIGLGYGRAARLLVDYRGIEYPAGSWLASKTTGGITNGHIWIHFPPEGEGWMWTTLLPPRFPGDRFPFGCIIDPAVP